MASPTPAEVAAPRPDSCGCGFDYFYESSARKALLAFGQLDAYDLPRQSKGHKDRTPIIKASHGIAAVGNRAQSYFTNAAAIWTPHGSTCESAEKIPVP